MSDPYEIDRVELTCPLCGLELWCDQLPTEPGSAYLQAAMAAHWQRFCTGAGRREYGGRF